MLGHIIHASHRVRNIIILLVFVKSQRLRCCEIRYMKCNNIKRDQKQRRGHNNKSQ